MRAIKFRVWDGVDLMYPPPMYSSTLGTNFFTMDGRCYIEGMLQEFTLQQYTGLKDKNGVEIYEGDILQHPEGKKFTVKWNEAYCAFRAFYIIGDSWSDSNLAMQVSAKGAAVVIGNIYETPELKDKP